ncbi:cobalamin biosynthesis protein [Mobilicoccus pelagius]|uniref:Cobalamin biosynthesis protein CobD n=1 Tax=Mobilicoccus pelagius NBRC 104925 TaxID=1089455 RepID=H5UQ62_9MICO|nr:cobalamin biosynthesis protein [Mobilicoccus pelagius]GAB47867.1 cobalamin biosynthesis protein CobD [Mobilicoccus pelagius NBRC 104925]
MNLPARTLGLTLGYAADLRFGDPRRGHPVAAFGSVAGRLRGHLGPERSGRGRRGHGVLYTSALVGGSVALGAATERLARGHRAAETLLVAAATWAVLGGTSLAREGATMAGLLDDAGRTGDLAPARARLSHLCSRDATDLTDDEIARAAVESLAENTSDAVTAPLFWGAVAGVPGLLGYRAANTLDAMVGYRTPELREFGWASARFDDLVNLAPARLTAALTCVLAPLVGGRPAEAWRIWRRDAAGHPSPNAGPVEATAAGALGRRLGGANTYAGETEDRGRLGDGPPPGTADLPRAVRLSRAVSLGSVVVCAVLALVPTRASRATSTPTPTPTPQEMPR